MIPCASHFNFLILFSLALLGAGCASTPSPIQKAEIAINAGRFEEGLGALEALSRKESDAKDYHVALVKNRGIALERLNREAKNALDADRIDDADALYNRLLAIDANNGQAKIGKLRLLDLRKRTVQLTKAEELFHSGDMEGAERKLRGVLQEDSTNRKALELLRKINDRQNRTITLAPVLGLEFKKTISLEFKDAALKDIFDAIWHASGINFILDRDVRNDLKASIYVREVSIEEAIEALLMGQQLTKKVVSAKTLFIYPKTPQKLSEYQDLTVRNFFLAYADAKQIQTLLKTILKTKEVYVDEKRNLIVIRDNQESVDLAEKLIRAHDQPEPEVMLALDVIEISRSKLKEVGISFPTQIGLGVSNPISVQALRQLNASGINIGFGGLAATTSTTGVGSLGTLSLTDTNSDTNLLANPRIRVRNREKAKIHIGDRLPLVTTTSSSTSSFVGQTVNYLDIGLKLEVEPQVMLDDDVVVKLNLEVSTATPSKVSTGFYDVGTRNTTSVLTIHDGETQVLAGLIQDNERNSASHLPGLGDIPLLGRLFSDESKGRDKSEIILAITPHILNNLVRPSAELIEYSSGTESGQRTPVNAAANALSVKPLPVNPLPEGLQKFMPVSTPGSVSGSTSTGNSATTGATTSSPPAPSSGSSSLPPAGGVIPMVDFAAPPGVGSASGGK